MTAHNKVTTMVSRIVFQSNCLVSERQIRCQTLPAPASLASMSKNTSGRASAATTSRLRPSVNFDCFALRCVRPAVAGGNAVGSRDGGAAATVIFEVRAVVPSLRRAARRGYQAHLIQARLIFRSDRACCQVADGVFEVVYPKRSADTDGVTVSVAIRTADVFCASFGRHQLRREGARQVPEKTRDKYVAAVTFPLRIDYGSFEASCQSGETPRGDLVGSRRKR
jgi:hypothetical protein